MQSHQFIKYAFRIKTRLGVVVDNLMIHGRDEHEAQRKLRQVYHHCVVLEAREIPDAAATDASDFEGVISLIANEGRRGER